MPVTKTTEVIACEKCGCTFFEHVIANRFTTVSTVPDMAPNAVHRLEMNVLRCLRCANIVLPPADISSTLNSVQQIYTEFVNETTPDKQEQSRKMVGSRKTLGVIESWDTAIPMFPR